ncbi:hypothetical protein OHB53_09425 [Streptomyces sp. NBC_00056]
MNLRLTCLGIERKPHSNAASTLIAQAWPRADHKRDEITRFSLARKLWVFIRRNLGDASNTEPATTATSAATGES